MDEYLIPLPAVMARTGLSRSKVYKDARNGTFPRPIKIGSGRRTISRWRLTEVDAWIKRCIVENGWSVGASACIAGA